MKGLYILTLPFLWASHILLLAGMIAVHIVVAPVRAFIYWGRSVSSRPGWRGWIYGSETELGISVAPRR